MFCFDQSSNHTAYAPDALLVSRMTLGPKIENKYDYKDGCYTRQVEGSDVSFRQEMFEMKDGVRHFKGIKMVSLCM